MPSVERICGTYESWLSESVVVAGRDPVPRLSRQRETVLLQVVACRRSISGEIF
jgi:hypothetical protein